MDLYVRAARFTVRLPDDWSALGGASGDQRGPLTYELHSPGTRAVVLVSPVTPGALMAFSELTVIGEVRRTIGATSAIVEVATGISSERLPYVYSIVKMANEPNGMHYTLRLHILAPSAPVQVLGHFDEIGVTGQRDALVMELCLRNGSIQIGSDLDPEEPAVVGWMRDPYDGATDGFRRTLAEDATFDAMFPNHPLSHARRTIAHLTGADR